MSAPADKPEQTETLEQLMTKIWQHLAERDWDHPTQRALAISISLEANELLEHYQWSEEAVGDKEALAEELADVLIYSLQYAHVLGIDPAAAVIDKLAKSARKYPAENFKGKSGAERREQWLQAKINHRDHKKGL